jgi:2,3-bisphosphoglycerate-dependent phosphoglycerate mutase
VPAVKTLYLIRHGQPKLGTGIAYDRAPGPPLDETGVTEATAAGRYLAHCDVTRLLCSPLERTQQTAAHIAAMIGAPVYIEALLAEQRGDEAFDSVKTRMRDLLQRIETLDDTAIGLVTHGSPIKAALQLLSRETINLTPYAFAGGNHAPTAGIWRAEHTGDAWALMLVFEPNAKVS